MSKGISLRRTSIFRRTAFSKGRRFSHHDAQIIGGRPDCGVGRAAVDGRGSSIGPDCVCGGQRSFRNDGLGHPAHEPGRQAQRSCPDRPRNTQKNPQDLDAYIGYAWSLNALEEYQKAKEIAQAGYAKFKDPRLAQALGEALYYLGENEAALANFQEYLAKLPEGSKAAVTFYLCGELFVRMGKFNHADIAFSTALQYAPNNARWWARLGWVREKIARYLPALKAYEQAVNLNPNLQDALSGKTRMLAKIQD